MNSLFIRSSASRGWLRTLAFNWLALVVPLYAALSRARDRASGLGTRVTRGVCRADVALRVVTRALTALALAEVVRCRGGAALVTLALDVPRVARALALRADCADAGSAAPNARKTARAVMKALEVFDMAHLLVRCGGPNLKLHPPHYIYIQRTTYMVHAFHSARQPHVPVTLWRQGLCRFDNVGYRSFEPTSPKL